jgi:hypothetical protein
MRLAPGHLISLAKIASRFHLQTTALRQLVFPDACATKVIKEPSTSDLMLVAVAKLVGSSIDLAT